MLPKRGRRGGSSYGGGLVAQTNPDRPSGTLTERRCRNGCGFYLKRLGACPGCGDAPKFNAHARKTILDSHLRSQAEHAQAHG